MNFCNAIESLNKGNEVRRIGWGIEYKYLELEYIPIMHPRENIIMTTDAGFTQWIPTHNNIVCID